MEAGGGGGQLTGTAGQAPVHLPNNYIIIGRGQTGGLDQNTTFADPVTIKMEEGLGK
jgi:hypothetical protein